MTHLKLVIADDHPLFRAALKQAISRQLPHAQFIETSSLPTLQEAIVEHPDVDLILLDLIMPGARGFASLLYLRAEHPSVPIIIMSASESASVVQRALDLGASGFIPKSAHIETIGKAIRTILGGGISAPPIPTTLSKAELHDRELARRLSTLTPQQVNVLILLAEGRINRSIAAYLAIAEATVKAHVTGILRKLHIERRTQAAILAQRLLQTGEWLDTNGLHDEG